MIIMFISDQFLPPKKQEQQLAKDCTFGTKKEKKTDEINENWKSNWKRKVKRKEFFVNQQKD